MGKVEGGNAMHSWGAQPLRLKQSDSCMMLNTEQSLKYRHAAWLLAGSGRLVNVYVVLHSASVLFYAGFPMHRCAGTITLGAALDGVLCSVADARTAPRLLMHILGSLDGQARLPQAAWAAATAAPMAPQFGAR
jgi:hypothetical protein